MWFGKNKLNRFAVVLAMAVSAVSSFAADVAPFSFGGLGASDTEWDRLLKYKIWGTGDFSLKPEFNGYGVAFTGQQVYVTDEVGFVGSAKGGLLFRNIMHSIGGPLAFKGNFDVADGQDEILTGPSHFGGNVTFSQNAWNNDNVVIKGNICVDGSVNYADKALGKNTVTVTCDADKVPDIDFDLDIPSVSPGWTRFSDVRDNLTVTNTTIIKIPEGKTVYDIHIKGDIDFREDSRLFFDMPKGGRATRVFVDGQIKIDGTHHDIGVMYDGVEVENKEYAGSLLFYTPNSISFPAQECNIQGTFISGGTIEFQQHYKFAGQLLAKQVTLNAEFRAEDFRYVRFQSTKFKRDANGWGQLREGVEWVGKKQALTVELTEKPSTDVTFKYCFIFRGNAGFSKSDNLADGELALASENDVNTNSIPLCPQDKNYENYTGYGTAKFNKGETTLAKDIEVEIANDNIVEYEEHFSIHVFDLRGAVVSDDGTEETPFEGDFDISIIDDDDLFVGKDTVVVINEDEPYVFSAKNFPVYTTDGEPWDGEFAIRIVNSVKQKDSLRIDGVKVDQSRDIPSKEILTDLWFGGMIYYPPEDAYGDKLDYFEYKIIRSGNASIETYKMYINITPVNDAPDPSTAVFKIKENSVFGSVDGIAEGSIKVTDKDTVDLGHFNYKFDEKFDKSNTEANYKVVTALYEIDPNTGLINVKDGAKLNYESKDSVLTIRVVVSDSSKSTGKLEDALSDTVTVTIKMINVNEAPTVAKNQVFTVPENSPEKTVVLPKDWKNGNPKNVQASDPDTSAIPWGKLTYSIPVNTDNDKTNDVPFNIDSKTGVITVKAGADLDFEDPAKSNFKFYVKVVDGTMTVDGKTVGGLADSALVVVNVTNVNEPPKLIDDGKDSYVAVEHSKKDSVINRWEIKDEEDGVDELRPFIKDLKTTAKIKAEDIFGVRVVEDGSSLFLELFVADSAKLDFETIYGTLGKDSTFSVRIILKDQKGVAGCNADSLDRKIKVSDINEAPSVKDLPITVRENAPKDTVIGALVVTEKDVYNKKFSTLTYEILTPGVPFVMDSNKVKVKDSKSLDYETVKDHKFTFDVKVSDGEYYDIATVTVTLTDENEGPKIDPDCDPATQTCTDPKCDATIQDCDTPNTPPDSSCTENCGYKSGDTLIVQVRENSKTGLVLFEYLLKDEDGGTTAGLDADSVYMLNSNNSGADSLFKIEKVKSGDVYKLVVSVKESSKLDYEKIKHTHMLVLGVVDPKNTALRDTVIRAVKVIDVNEAPTADPVTKTISENLPNGTEVAKVSAKDPDTYTPAFHKLTYTIVEDVPFYMDGNVIRVKDSSKLDYETLLPDHKFVFTVKVSDGEFFATSKVTITLKDENEGPKIDPGCDPDDPKCKDPEVCDATFQDCDTPDVPPDSNCTVNCGYKKGDKIIVNVDENSKTGLVLFEYVIKDEDAGSNGIANDTVYFVNSNKSGADSLFKIEKVKSGDVYKLVVSVKDSSKLNYEKIKNTHELILTVSDPKNLNLKDTVVRTINVIDINEAPSVKDFSKTIAENLPNGSEVGSLVASDPDVKNPKYSHLTYTIVDAENVPFTLDSNVIKVKDSSKLDYETLLPDHKFTFKVVVSDGQYSDISTVTITLKDVNEGPKIDPGCDPSDPKCKDPEVCDATFQDCDQPNTPPDSSCTENCGYKKGDNIIVNVPENSKTGLVLIEYVIKDEDEGDKGAASDSVYFVNSNKSGADSLFKIEKVKDGDVYKLVVSVKDGALLDYETTKHSHELVLTVVDPKTPSLIDTVIRTINIIDVNEPPYIVDGEYKIKENQPKGAVVGRVEFGDDKDLDGVSNPDFRMNIVRPIGGDTDKFDITKDGYIKTKKVFDYETDDKEYVLIVEVFDMNEPTLSSIDTMKIKLVDVFERSNVEITKVVSGDSTYYKPDSIYVNQPTADVFWRNGVTEDGKKTIWQNPLDSIYSLVPGRNVIYVTYGDPSANTAAVDSVVIYYSNTLPTVTISAAGDDATAHNIYTIVEHPAEKDSNIYVNHETNNVVITIHDPAKKFTGNKSDTSIVIPMDLGTATVDAKTYNSINEVVKQSLTVNPILPSDAKHVMNADSSVNVSYVQEIAGISVTVSYTEDKDGDIVSVPVTQSNGKVKDIPVMKVTYVAKDQNGKEITVSYYADAYTGEALMSDSMGNLMTGSAADKLAGASSKNPSAGLFNVSYNASNNKTDSLMVSYTVDRKGNLIKSPNGDIGYSVSYTYTDICNNSKTSSVFIVLDKALPEVVIVSPSNRDIIYSNFTEVVWTVDGVVQDTLTTQGLQPGMNVIVRFYRDKAGNEASDTIRVTMKDGKNVDLAVEVPVAEISKEKVDKYYSKNPPEKGQTFAVTLKNPKTGKEVETLKGGSFGNKEGSGEEPYPGLGDDEPHLGPTLVMNIKLPVISGKDGLATLDDILSKDGLYVLKEGIDASTGDIKGIDSLTGEIPDDGKILIADYVREHCVDEAQISYKPGDDLSKFNLYESKLNVKIWIYTSLGSFVDYYSFSQDLNNPDYADDAGMLKMFFELKPDENGDVRAEDGRLMATGAYLYKVEATVRSTARCDIPSLTSTSGRKKNDVVKNSDDLLKSFGYKRPSTK